MSSVGEVAADTAAAAAGALFAPVDVASYKSALISILFNSTSLEVRASAAVALLLLL